MYRGGGVSCQDYFTVVISPQDFAEVARTDMANFTDHPKCSSAWLTQYFWVMIFSCATRASGATHTLPVMSI